MDLKCQRGDITTLPENNTHDIANTPNTKRSYI